MIWGCTLDLRCSCFRENGDLCTNVYVEYALERAENVEFELMPPKDMYASEGSYVALNTPLSCKSGWSSISHYQVCRSPPPVKPNKDPGVTYKDPGVTW